MADSLITPPPKRLITPTISEDCDSALGQKMKGKGMFVAPVRRATHVVHVRAQRYARVPRLHTFRVIDKIVLIAGSTPWRKFVESEATKSSNG